VDGNVEKVKLLQTVKKGNGHKHIVYLNDGMSIGYTSLTKDHVHPVTFQVEQKLAEDGGIVPAGSGRWVIGEANGHTHEMTEIVATPKANQETEEEIVADCLSLFKTAKDLEKEARDIGKESLKFYQGDQWDTTTKSELEKQKRAVLTINEIESKCDLLSGYQRQNRTDIKYMPMEEGDQKVAEILNIVSKNILENCNYRFEETDVFDDQSIIGRGIFNMYIDYSKDIRGDIIVEKFEWDDCYFGPHTKKDLSDCEYLIKTKWYSQAKLKELYPDKEIKTADELGDLEDKEVREPVGDKYAKTDNKIRFSTINDPELVDIAKKSFRVLETWRKEYKRSYVVVDVASDFFYNASDWPETDIKALETIPAVSVIPRVVYRMRVTKTAADVFLEDEYPDLAMQDFHIIPVYAKKRGDLFWGKVHSVKDPQREINKRHSQMVDIMNRQAAYGWFTDDTTFPTPQEEKNFKNNSSSPGFVQRVTSVKSLPEKVEGAKVPTEVIELLTIESQTLRGIMNINLEMEGSQSNAQSGVAILERKKQGLVGNEFLFDNFTIAKVKIGRLLAAMIQKYYSPERIMRIVYNENIKSPVTVGGNPLEGQEAELQALIENTDLTKYDVVVGESGWSPTVRIANFMMWAELAGKGLPVPPELLIELSDLPEKDKVLQQVQAMQQQAAQAEQDKNQVEILKTQIAASAKTQGQETQTQ